VAARLPTGSARPAAAAEGSDGFVGEVFSALADPTRRAVLRAVAERGQASATDLGAAVGVTRQAVAKHLDQLAAAGLVADDRQGRERLWRVTPAPMATAADWLAANGAAWDARLARLAALAPTPDASTANGRAGGRTG